MWPALTAAATPSVSAPSRRTRRLRSALNLARLLVATSFGSFISPLAVAAVQLGCACAAAAQASCVAAWRWEALREIEAPSIIHMPTRWRTLGRPCGVVWDIARGAEKA